MSNDRVVKDWMVEDWVIENRVVADSVSEDLGDVVAVDIDILLGFADVGEECVDEVMVLEYVENIAGDDVILDFVVVGEDRNVDDWTFEEADVVADVVSRLEEEVGRRLDEDPVLESLEKVVSADDDVVLNSFDVSDDIVDETSTLEDSSVVVDVFLTLEKEVVGRVDEDSVLEDTEEVVRADDDIIPEALEVGEDKVDDTSTVEDGEDVACVDDDSAPRSVEVAEDARDVTECFINVVL